MAEAEADPEKACVKDVGGQLSPGGQANSDSLFGAQIAALSLNLNPDHKETKPLLRTHSTGDAARSARLCAEVELWLLAALMGLLGRMFRGLTGTGTGANMPATESRSISGTSKLLLRRDCEQVFGHKVYTLVVRFNTGASGRE
ncbi:hypothetical protein DUNSADRAFT_13186 [Dunaliella salina]|uniref:Encoded protein n=1 Tax=Dunaliella salina TaxID=3046 RepID=A0ABQ7G9W4_DUNSA|nr:hypothetical protein DUNSADRAFT_13186 [Dunaliella salina]|eukprot:KAF5831396.1 hypothetical protein DUNSADRAFT_13186 [Dunaliella salina]